MYACTRLPLLPPWQKKTSFHRLLVIAVMQNEEQRPVDRSYCPEEEDRRMKKLLFWVFGSALLMLVSQEAAGRILWEGEGFHA